MQIQRAGPAVIGSRASACCGRADLVRVFVDIVLAADVAYFAGGLDDQRFPVYGDNFRRAGTIGRPPARATRHRCAHSPRSRPRCPRPGTGGGMTTRCVCHVGRLGELNLRNRCPIWTPVRSILRSSMGPDVRARYIRCPRARVARATVCATEAGFDAWLCGRWSA